MTRNAGSTQDDRTSGFQPSVQDIEALAEFIPRLYGRDAQPTGRLVGGRKADGTLTMPWYEYNDTVEDFMGAIINAGWLDHDYDPATAQELLMDERAITYATIPQVRQMLTAVVRGERFCDGWWMSVIDDGRVRRVLERLGEIGRAMQADARKEHRR